MNAHQLDLFLDSHEVTLANEVVAALCAHDRERTAQGIARLRAEAPARADLPTFDSLYAFLDLTREIDTAGLDADALELIVEVLNTRMIPAAAVLGKAAKGFLESFWRQLARAAIHPFNPDRPHLHAADLFLRAGAYEAAEEAAKTITGGQTQRAVLRWQAIARYRLAGLPGARRQIFSLAWHAADSFEDLLRELDDALLKQDWLAFQAAVEDTDASWFPAWYLLRYPESAAAIDADLAPGSAPTAASIPALQACLRLIRILDLEKQGHSRALIEQRARLQALDAGFFAVYMRARDVQHR
ncbi:MAG: hypothetical protein KBE22_04480 [Candidatus Accumulibacter sp.]|nr:hypothetical protein [Accumulibacter sp.]